MKLPAALSGLDKEKAIQFLLAHGDKAIVGLLAMLAAWIAWVGIDAIRSKSVTAQRLPKAITDTATQASAHIDRLANPPPEVRVKPEPLAARVQPWQSPKITPVVMPPVFDQPLFEELARRTTPDVLPIENLTARAGLAVLAVADLPVAPGEPPAPATAVEPKGKGKDQRGKRDDRRPDGPFGGFGAPPPAEAAALGQSAGANLPKGRIVPFVVVTGLVPYAKQRAEYERRFSQASFRDQRRDSPIWSEYLVERAEVNPGGGAETWKRVNLKALAESARTQWAGVQQESLPADLFMPLPGSGMGPGAPQPMSFKSYCLPLPKLAIGGWGPETMHPGLFDLIRESWAKPDSAVGGQGPVPDPSTEQPERQSPDFGNPDDPNENGGIPALSGESGLPGLEPEQKPTPPYRLFRLVDTSVEPGKSYRYQVRVSVWNPNFKLPARHLDAAATAKAEKLASPASEPSAAASVPQPTSVLVRSLSKGDMKKFKPGMIEALVIGESATTGNYALRSVITEIGGLVNVDDSLNKPSEVRSRGEEIRTDRVIVDVRGRQADRAEELAGGRSPVPPEPFELLVLKPDGSFEVASVADSQAVIDANVATLPVIESMVKQPTGERGPFGEPGFPPVPGSRQGPGQPRPGVPF